MADDSALDRLSLEGELDSSGQFQVDLDGLSRNALRHLPAPEYFLLKLVQGLLAQRVTSIACQVRASHIEMEFLCSSPVDWTRGDLALGLLAARQIGYRPSPQESRLKLELGPTRRFWEVFSRYRSGIRIIRLLNQRLRLSTTPIVLNGQVLNRCIDGPVMVNNTGEILPPAEADALYYFLGHIPPLDRVLGPTRVHLVFPPVNFSTRWAQVHWWQGHFDQPSSWQPFAKVELPRIRVFGLLPRRRWEIDAQSWSIPAIRHEGQATVGYQAIINKHPRKRATLHLVHQGLMWEPEYPEELPDGYVYWASAFGLQSDLSGFRVVRDQAYRNLLASLQELLRLGLEADSAPHPPSKIGKDPVQHRPEHQDQ